MNVLENTDKPSILVLFADPHMQASRLEHVFDVFLMKQIVALLTGLCIKEYLSNERFKYSMIARCVCTHIRFMYRCIILSKALHINMFPK